MTCRAQASRPSSARISEHGNIAGSRLPPGLLPVGLKELSVLCLLMLSKLLDTPKPYVAEKTLWIILVYQWKNHMVRSSAA